MIMTVGDNEVLRTLAKRCAVSSQTVEDAQCVQTQCMYATRTLKWRCIVSTSSLVSCLESCLLFTSFQFVVCDDAAVRRTLVLIAFHLSHCFPRSHFSENFAV